uniref:Uncharacterized protein n=1 Tax=Anguilla anguilla TaxID=7936 RepID=A0A0E9TNN7_ANGAN
MPYVTPRQDTCREQTAQCLIKKFELSLCISSQG